MSDDPSRYTICGIEKPLPIVLLAWPIVFSYMVVTELGRSYWESWTHKGARQ